MIEDKTHPLYELDDQECYNKEMNYLDHLLTNKIITSEDWDRDNQKLIKIYEPKEPYGDDYKEYLEKVIKKTWENIEKVGGIEKLKEMKENLTTPPQSIFPEEWEN